MLSLTVCDAVSSLGKKDLGVGGRVLSVKALVGEDSGDFVMVVFKGVGRRGLRGGMGMEEFEGMLV